MEKLTVIYRHPKDLKANPHNANRHPEKQVHQIGKSIYTFGNINPILINEHLTIIAGHGRLDAALDLGLDEVPTIMVSHLSKDQQRTLLIADNKIAKNAVWDIEALKVEIEYILSIDDDLADALAFGAAELDIILDDGSGTGSDPADVVDEIDRSVPAKTKLGDLYQLGSNRIFCGDACSLASYAALLMGDVADLAALDHPYNLPGSAIGGLGKTKHPDFAEASGEMSRSEFQGFLDLSLGLVRDHCRDGAIIMAFMDWRHIDQLLQAGRSLALELKNICAWVKTNAGMGSLYRSQHELIAVFKYGTAPHVNNVELGKHGRYRTNVWTYAGANTFRKGRMEDLATHPTVKPIALVADAIKDCTRRGDIVLDAFGGSGTTLLAAERTGRRARLIEIDPYYIDATIARWQKMTGGTPVLLSSVGEVI